jgi:hypothetical protein
MKRIFRRALGALCAVALRSDREAPNADHAELPIGRSGDVAHGTVAGTG